MSIRANYHGHGVPSVNALDTPFGFSLPRVGDLLVCWDGVDVGGVGVERHLHARCVRPLFQLLKQKTHPIGAVMLQGVVELFHPFPGFGRVDIRGWRVQYVI